MAVSMAGLYAKALERWEGKSQWEIFCDVTKGCTNIVVIKEDSRKVRLPATKVCFGFIDGNHDPDSVKSDFYLLWERLSPGGCIAFHDYGADLPQTTATIDQILATHSDDIGHISYSETKWILFLTRKRSV